MIITKTIITEVDYGDVQSSASGREYPGINVSPAADKIAKKDKGKNDPALERC
ncbi:hypothetical protein [Candidatus Electrothrix sp.]|uniref:hypothetical protein n=1 Tax=Candidatus Electrothrix sp. TaxID=2170559 RepID=UPI00405623D6